MIMSRLLRSFSYAIQGLYYAVVHGANMRIHLLAAATVITVGIIVGLSSTEWAILSITIFMVLCAETINSAIEKTVDLACPERHPMAKLAKDMAAGGVLLAALNAIVVAVLIFGPAFKRLFG